mmetsp:Transcript_37484/g.57403  ORF Transcript_37484/g.57403 Transcript_37484/m.57403 type:complete len:333 (+) Transcript_37484:3077-4075(+)
MLLTKNFTICQAFFFAKDRIEKHEDIEISKEAFKFLIIRDIDHYDKVDQRTFYQEQLQKKAHPNCWPIGPFEKGSIQEVGKDPRFKVNIQADIYFKGRGVEMREVIRCLHNNNLVTMVGWPGIGKTSIAKHLALHYQERQVFDDGIIYLSLKNKGYANELIQELYKQIKHSLTTAELHQLNMRTKQIKAEGEWRRDSHPKQTDLDQDEDLKKVSLNRDELEKIIETIRGWDILLIFDAIEGFVKDEKDFLNVIKELLSSCPTLKILTTSWKPLLTSMEDWVEKTVRIGSLEPSKAMDLFLELAGYSLLDEDDRADLRGFVEETKDRRETIIF